MGKRGHTKSKADSGTGNASSSNNGAASNNTDGNNNLNQLSPQSIYDHLDQHVIGQDEAKRTLAVALYNHLKRIDSIEKNPTKNKGETSSTSVLLLLFFIIMIPQM